MYDDELVHNMLSMSSNMPGFFDLPSKDAETFLNRSVISDGNFPNSIDTFLNKFRINFIKILSELINDCLIVFVIDNSNQNFTKLENTYIFSFLM